MPAIHIPTMKNWNDESRKAKLWGVPHVFNIIHGPSPYILLKLWFQLLWC